MKFGLRSLLLICSLSLCSSITIAQTNGMATSVSSATTRRAFVIPINGAVERGLLYLLRRGVDEAERMTATDIILHMHTPGGSVAVTEEIIRLLIDLPEGVKTYTFVDKDALSAGSLIALSTDHIYMSPGSRIGASAIVTPAGDLEEGDLKEKHVSALVALISSAAERKGHDKKLAEAMIRRDAEYKIGEEIICPEGELLTLTDIDAERVVERDGVKQALLSEGTIDSLEELFDRVGISREEVVTLEITWSEKVARWIELFSALFLIGGVLGLYIEFKIPGFGVPGVIGIVCLAIFFWGHHIAGLAGAEEAILFCIGAFLLAVEIFVIPGFGVTGISGISLMFLAILMAMVQHHPGGSWAPPEIQYHAAIRNFSIFLGLTFAAMVVLARYLPRSTIFQRLALNASESGKDGFQSSRDTTSMVGLTGLADTSLHPAGIGIFGGKRVNVITRGEFIEQGSPIIIAEAHGNRIIVEDKKSSSIQACTEDTA